MKEIILLTGALWLIISATLGMILGYIHKINQRRHRNEQNERS